MNKTDKILKDYFSTRVANVKIPPPPAAISAIRRPPSGRRAWGGAAAAAVFAASLGVFISAPPGASELSRALAAAAQSADIGDNTRESLRALGYAYRMHGKNK